MKKVVSAVAILVVLTLTVYVVTRERSEEPLDASHSVADLDATSTNAGAAARRSTEDREDDASVQVDSGGAALTEDEPPTMPVEQAPESKTLFLRGVVRAESGAPLAGVKVGLEQGDGSRAVLRFDYGAMHRRLWKRGFQARVRSDEEGRFEISGVEEGFTTWRSSLKATRGASSMTSGLLLIPVWSRSSCVLSRPSKCSSWTPKSSRCGGRKCCSCVATPCASNRRLTSSSAMGGASALLRAARQ